MLAWTGVRLALFEIKTEADLMPDGLSLMLFIFTPDWVRKEFLKNKKTKKQNNKKKQLLQRDKGNWVQAEMNTQTSTITPWPGF